MGLGCFLLPADSLASPPTPIHTRCVSRGAPNSISLWNPLKKQRVAHRQRRQILFLHKKTEDIHAKPCLQSDISALFHPVSQLLRVVFWLGTHTILQQHTLKWQERRPAAGTGTQERGNRGRSEIPEVLGTFCPCINRLWSLWNFISHKVDSMLCNFYRPFFLRFYFF